MYNTLQIINLVLVILLGAAQVYNLYTAPSRKRKQEQKEADEKEKKRKENQVETDRCVLRNIITDFYYSNRSTQKMRQYEYENLHKIYDQYKAIDGNSFIDKIWGEMEKWEIVE